MDEISYDLKGSKKVFSRVGFAVSAILVVATVAQLLWAFIPEWIWGEENPLTSSTWNVWLATIVPLYLIAMPVGVLILRKLPAQKPQDHKLGLRQLLVLFAISYCIMYAGNLIGTVLSLLLSGGTAENAVANYAMDTNPLKILVMVILAPLMEEFICRKQIIDRTARFGEKTAVILSALIFGLLHQNLFQFFYAFGIGIILGYIYIRTGRLRYTVILHTIVNFLGSVVAPWILSLVDLEALTTLDLNGAPEDFLDVVYQILPGALVFWLYSMLLTGVVVFGLVMLIIRFKKATWNPAKDQLPQGTVVKTVYLNAGMIVYILLCLASCVWALF